MKSFWNNLTNNGQMWLGSAAVFVVFWAAIYGFWLLGKVIP